MSWEGIGIILTAFGSIVVGFWTYRQQTKKEDAAAVVEKQRLYHEMEQELLTNYREDLRAVRAENEVLLKAQKRLQEQLVEAISAHRECQGQITLMGMRIGSLEELMSKMQEGAG